MTDKKKFLQVALAPTRELVGPPAPIVPFADWDYYYVKGKVEWRPSPGSEANINVDVPVGFVTDLASIPSAFWSLLPPTGRYTYPAILHDFLYWEQPCTRDVADQVLKDAMVFMKVSSVDTFAIHKAVRVGGGGTWDSNSRARQSGEKRVLKLFPDDVNVTWEQWKKRPDVFI